MVQFLSIHIFFLGFLQFLLGFSKVPFFVSPFILAVRCAYNNGNSDLLKDSENSFDKS